MWEIQKITYIYNKNTGWLSTGNIYYILFMQIRILLFLYLKKINYKSIV